MFRVNVEGVLVVNATLNSTPTSGHPLDRGHSHCHRRDGRLTVSNCSGASSNKVSYLDIDRPA